MIQKTNTPSYKCPKCGGSNFKRWEFPHPIIAHWMLNPGLVFNEIVLGQRLPKTQLICNDCEGSVLDRAYVPCPSCETMHHGRVATGKMAFGNWRGIGFPTCHAPIPCLWNVFSLVVLALSFPLWALPYFLYFRKKPLLPTFQSEGNLPPTPKRLTKKSFAIMGAAWGGTMWLSMLFLSVLKGGDVAPWRDVLISLPLWACGGFAFGFSMWYFLGRAPKQRKPECGSVDIK